MKRKQSHNAAPQSQANTVTAASRLRFLCAVALLALFVARPFTPGDSIAALGDGLPAVILSLVLLCVYVGSLVLGGVRNIRFGTVDAAVMVLFAIEILAAAVGAQYGEPRAGVNIMWELTSLATMYLLARQLFRPADARAVMAVMIVVALAQSSFGLYQYFVSMPADRALYLEDPDAALRMAQVDAPDGSATRQLYEQRLMSTEPMGRFDLANSLAGFLATWLVVLLAATGFGANKKLAAWIAPLAMAVPISICLLLTKSRSAVLAAGVGFALAALVAGGRKHLATGRMRIALAVGVVALVVLVGLVWSMGGIDAQVLSEAPKSLGYRLQYWQSTLAMIADHPWLGCGGGNFQDRYTQYKLATASEEIADPHNFVFDVWANSGTLALLAMLAMFLLLARTVWRAASATTDHATQPEEPYAPLPLMFAGSIAGLVLAFAFGLLGEVLLSPLQLLGLLVVTCTAIWGLKSWTAGPVPSIAVPVLGLIVMLVNFAAAGGFHFPAVAGSMWLLIALTVTLCETDSPPIAAPRPALVAGLIISLIVLLGCYYTGYSPVLQCNLLLRRTHDRQLSYQKRVQLLQEAAEADPLSAKPWWALAALEAQRLQGAPQAAAADLGELPNYAQAFLHRDPFSSSAHAQVGDWYWDIYQRSKNLKALKAATETYQRSVVLYPNDASRRARLAVALQASQMTDESATQREKALQLDQLTPHADKKLTEDLKQRLLEAQSPRN